MLSFYELSQKMLQEAGPNVAAGPGMVAGPGMTGAAAQQAGQKPAVQPPDPAIMSLQKALTQIKDPQTKSSLTNLVNTALVQKQMTGKVPATAGQITAAQTMQAFQPNK